PRHHPSGARWQEDREIDGEMQGWPLTVTLRGRGRAPDWCRERTLYSRARGDTTVPHRRLQRVVTQHGARKPLPGLINARLARRTATGAHTPPRRNAPSTPGGG